MNIKKIKEHLELFKTSMISSREVAKKHLNKQSAYGGYHNGVNTACDAALSWISQLESDLANVEYNQKVEVPQYVADWYEEHKHDILSAKYSRLATDEDKKVRAWYSECKGRHPNPRANAQEVIAKMDLNGYEVVEEPKYITALTANRGHKWLLAKTNEGNIVVEKVGFSNFEKKLSSGRYFLTEEEIKSMDRGGQLFVNYSEEVDLEKYN